MARFLVTEYQRIRYTWVVEAPSAEIAHRSADGGVPDAAHEKLTGSDVEATPLGDAEEPDQYWCAECDEFSTGEPCDKHE